MNQADFKYYAKGGFIRCFDSQIAKAGQADSVTQNADANTDSGVRSPVARFVWDPVGPDPERDVTLFDLAGTSRSEVARSTTSGEAYLRA